VHENRKPAFYRRRWFLITTGLVLFAALTAGITLEYVLHNAAPILRNRVIQTLSERFNAPVELDTLDISLMKGVEVSGGGLRIPYANGAQLAPEDQPRFFLKAEHFRFHSAIRALLHSPMEVGVSHVEGFTIDLPPGPQRAQLLGPREHVGLADPTQPRTQPKVTLLVDEILCDNAKLIVEVSDPRKEPHEFDITHLALHRTHDGDLSYNFEAQLTNPVPRGLINTTGHIGPWSIENPRESPVSGDYTFINADMNTIKGIGGTLNSTGHYSGVLDHISVAGTTDTPNFSLDISDHPMPLTTKFDAYVNGTTGDTTLNSVDGMLGHTHILAKGTVMNLKGKGHDIALDATIPDGHIDDVLYLGMKSQPPVMRGGVTMHSKIHIPPGKVRVVQKIELAGTLSINNATFTNPRIQNRLDGLSVRAQGHPEDVATASSDKIAEARSNLKTTFSLGHGQMTLSKVDYTMPGVDLILDGVYSMDASAFEFKGHVRTDAKASQMVSGWKHFLLKPIDPFLSRNGAGVELPISITGQKNDVHFGLAFKDADATPEEMRQDLKAKIADGTLSKPTKPSKEEKRETQEEKKEAKAAAKTAK